jgi:hypothetical protein
MKGKKKMFKEGDIVAVKIENSNDIDAKSVGQVAKILPPSSYPDMRTVMVYHRRPYLYNMTGTYSPKNLVKLDIQLLYKLWCLESAWPKYENKVKIIERKTENERLDRSGSGWYIGEV